MGLPIAYILLEMAVNPHKTHLATRKKSPARRPVIPRHSFDSPSTVLYPPETPHLKRKTPTSIAGKIAKGSRSGGTEWENKFVTAH